MADRVGNRIEALRNTMLLSQTELGKSLSVSAMTVSRWERGENLPESRDLLALGMLAQKAGLDGWIFWKVAGITRSDALNALALADGRSHSRG
jgi:transcriptional regulator with XRE-family HTH domain